MTLQVRHVDVSFGGNHVLRQVDLEVPSGFMGLIGPNGAGKTTLLNVISGYVRAERGRVLLDGAPLTGLRPHEVASAGVGRTFQTPRLVRELTVLENVLLGADGRSGIWHRLPPERVARARELLELFGLEAWEGREASLLPLASMKVVEVARALVAGPRLVLLDEPAAGLGVDDVELLVGPLRALAAESGLSVLIIEHDLELISSLCDRVAVLDFGVMIAEGSPAEVLRLPAVVSAYLGAGFAAVG